MLQPDRDKCGKLERRPVYSVFPQLHKKFPFQRTIYLELAGCPAFAYAHFAHRLRWDTFIYKILGFRYNGDLSDWLAFIDRVRLNFSPSQKVSFLRAFHGNMPSEDTRPSTPIKR
jgi:hypothetical protein